jgi:glycosyltransferase involved in cell wall biosynthesis
LYLNLKDSAIPDKPERVKVTLVIPIYNEAGHLQSFLTKIDALELPCDKELIFVDDCSRDSSGAILESFHFRSSHKIFKQTHNQGKGAALQRGIEEAGGDFIAIQDADFEYDPEDLIELVKPLLAGKADVIYGSRFKKSGHQVHRTFHYLVNRFLTVLSNALSGLYLTDMETCYKIFRAEIIKNIRLESKRFGFEPEITAKIARLKVRVEEHSIRYFPRNYLEGKKITWKDGIAAVWHLWRFNCLASKKSFYKSGLPDKYLPKGSQYL